MVSSRNTDIVCFSAINWIHRPVFCCRWLCISWWVRFHQLVIYGIQAHRSKIFSDMAGGWRPHCCWLFLCALGSVLTLFRFISGYSQITWLLFWCRLNNTHRVCSDLLIWSPSTFGCLNHHVDHLWLPPHKTFQETRQLRHASPSYAAPWGGALDLRHGC